VTAEQAPNSGPCGVAPLERAAERAQGA
jgi:hypothetical protein